MSDESICGCGTIDEAIKVAERLYVDAITTDCPAWALQIATAFQCLATRHLMSGMDHAVVVEGVIMVAQQTKENARSDEDLVAESLQKQKGLN